MERRKRLPDGTLSELENIGTKETEKEKVARLESENLTNMLAMTDMFESNVQLQQENTQLMLAVTDLFEMLTGGNA